MLQLSQNKRQFLVDHADYRRDRSSGSSGRTEFTAVVNFSATTSSVSCAAAGRRCVGGRSCSRSPLCDPTETNPASRHEFSHLPANSLRTQQHDKQDQFNCHTPRVYELPVASCQLFQKRTAGRTFCFLTDQMPFLLPKKQQQGTKGNAKPDPNQRKSPTIHTFLISLTDSWEIRMSNLFYASSRATVSMKINTFTTA